MSSFGERLHALRTERKLSQAKLAKLAGIPQSTIAQIESGRTKSTSKIIELADALETTPNYLLNGVADLKLAPLSSNVGCYSDKDVITNIGAYVTIPYFDINISPDSSNATWIVRDPAEKLVFHESWFEHRRIKPSSVKAMYVRGNSMQPLLYDMDTILLDESNTEIVDGDIYAVIYKKRLYIKELRTSENGIDIISYHSDYKTMHVTQETLKDFHVIGKMIWRGG